jgi:hypothetical protein
MRFASREKARPVALGCGSHALGPSPGTNSAPTSRPEWMLVQKEYASS